MEKEISKVIAVFTDGTHKEIKKGAVIGFEHKGDMVETNVELIDCTHSDIEQLVYGIAQLADHLGILGD